jgi:NAD(P)-dependent dehydrogenase (short-subunit alcohol dehydrogenase family)
MTATTAVVTGAAGAIGSAVAARLAGDGHTVVGVDIRTPDHAVSTEFMRCDLTDADAARVALGEIASQRDVGILVNVAGWTATSSFFEDDEEYWRRLVELNYVAVLRTCQLLVPAMCDRGWGRVVNIGSAAGQSGAGGVSVYAGTKAAVHGFTKSLAQEVASRGVTVNAVAPGTIDTPLSANDPAYTAKLARKIPRRRLGTPGDIAGAVTWLCGDDADYVTGQVLGVNGGLVMAG